MRFNDRVPRFSPPFVGQAVAACIPTRLPIRLRLALQHIAEVQVGATQRNERRNLAKSLLLVLYMILTYMESGSWIPQDSSILAPQRL